jgi:hypothetical protein
MGLSCTPVTAVLLAAISAAQSKQPRIMAILPAGSVIGVDEELRVVEDLLHPHSPIVFNGKTLHFAITKSGERIVPTNVSALWGGRTIQEVLAAEADLLGNAFLNTAANGKREPSYMEVSSLAPPVIASSIKCGDFNLGIQSFVGSRISEVRLTRLRSDRMFT